MVDKSILGLIGLATKAGGIAFGAESVETEIKKQKKVKLIILAEDASNRTKEKFKELGLRYNIPVVVIFNIEELSKAIGKNNKAIIGIKNESLANEILKRNFGGDVIG